MMASADHHGAPEEPTNRVGGDNYWTKRRRRETEFAEFASADVLEFKRKRRKDLRVNTGGEGSRARRRISPADGRRDNAPTLTMKPSTIEEDEGTTTATTTTTTMASPRDRQPVKLIEKLINIKEQQVLIANNALKCNLRRPANGLIVSSSLLLLSLLFIFISSRALQQSASLFSTREQHHHQYHLDRRYFITFASANEIITGSVASGRHSGAIQDAYDNSADTTRSPPPSSSSQLQEDNNDNGNSNNNNLPEPQAMAFNLLHELGSGDGLGYPGVGGVGGAGLRSGSQRQTFADSSGSSSSSVSPSLIEARCWNNYDSDNDCKLLNVITGPSDDESLRHQHKQKQSSDSATDDSDNIITPIVIFEASSTIEPQQVGNNEEDLFGGRQYFAQPPIRQSSSSSSSSKDQKSSHNNNNQYRTNHQHQTAPSTSTITANDFYSAPPQTATILPPAGYERPATRPSITNSRIFVATPSPGANKKTIKTTTMGRKCRDENDADCDEPETGDDNDTNQSSSSSSASDKRDPNGGDNDDESGGDDDDKDTRDNSGTRQDNGLGLDSSRHAGADGSIEPGSGGGAPFSPSDDNDDSTDDGDDGADDEDDAGGTGSSVDDSSLDGGSGNSIDSSSDPGPASSGADTRLLEVTSIRPQQSATAGASANSEQDAPRRTTTTATSSTPTHRAQTEAEIEVVVHSTLPASFPSTTRPTTPDGDEDAPSSTSTTPVPDETFTSKPIFPSSTSSSQTGSLTDGSGNEDEQQTATAGQAGLSTTEIDLYTFKPIPIPVEQDHLDSGRPSRFESSSPTQQQATAGNGYESQPNANGADQQGAASAATDADQQQQPVQEVSAQHIHEPAHRKPTMIYDGRGAFDDGWTTRRPLRAHSQLAQGSSARDAALQQQQVGSPDSFILSGKRTAASKTHIGTDMLPTLLLYASIIILVTTALIFVIMAYVFWRRNTIRRQTLMQKAHMLDRSQPPHAQMIQSMSHASQLIRGNGPGGGAGGQAGHMQPGLLSTYAPGKNMTMGKVTTTLVKPPAHGDDPRMLRNDADDADNDDDDGSERMFNKGNSKEQLVGDGGDDCGSIVVDNGQIRQGQAPSTRLTNGGPLKQSSCSTDEPTTSSGGSSSQRTQDSQQQQQLGGVGAMGPNGQQHQQYNSLVKSAHYPNSLSDGRQNSSSISDSQCSPDTSIGGPQQQAGPPPQMHHHNNNINSLNHHQMSGPAPQQYQQQNRQPQQQQMVAGPQMPMMMGPVYPPQAPTPFRPMYMHANGGPIIGSPIHRRPYPMNGGPQNGFAPKPRFATSRSIEDISPALAPQQHVGFIHPDQQQQLPYHQSAALQPQQHVMLPHLIQHRPTTQFSQQQQQQTLQLASPLHQQQMISPQRIAMNPLATLSRRYPPGTGLNRTIYSEDSSSFMTTSPSLARTSSSSSFAFNLSKHQSPSSIKAKPIVDASGRVTNDYTTQANFDGLPPQPPQNNGNGAAGGGPPVFGLRDRSEAWYV